jgi:hypothetical protein
MQERESTMHGVWGETPFGYRGEAQVGGHGSKILNFTTYFNSSLPFLCMANTHLSEYNSS